jgi:hypothetical protein
MNPAEFLSGYDNPERRALLWNLFQAAEQQAKTFAESSDRWVVSIVDPYFRTIV